METTTLETATTTQWLLDAAHSQIQFKVKHLMISTVTGTFKNFEGSIESEGNDFTKAKISFSAEASSINTGSEQRDTHLKSADFFDAEKYPVILFNSTSATKLDDENFELHGDFTLHGVTKNIKLTVEYSGTAKDPWGNTKAGFFVYGKINRKDFDLGWNAALEAGGVLVSEEVKIECEIQLAKKV